MKLILQIIDLDAESDVILRDLDEDSMDVLDFDEEQMASLSPETRTRLTCLYIFSHISASHIFPFLANRSIYYILDSKKSNKRG